MGRQRVGCERKIERQIERTRDRERDGLFCKLLIDKDRLFFTEA